MTWLIFTLIATIASGIFGILTHAGQKAMGDSVHGQYKALLFAGIGYSLVAIVGSGVMLAANSAQWSFPMKGLSLGILAGIAVVGVIFCNLLAFAAGGSPVVVVSIGAAGCGHDHLIHRCVAYQCGCCFDNRYTTSGRLTMAVYCRYPVSDIGYLYGDNLSAGNVAKLAQLNRSLR